MSIFAKGFLNNFVMSRGQLQRLLQRIKNKIKEIRG